MYTITSAVTVTLDVAWHTQQRRVCELHHYACTQLPSIYTCAANGTITNSSTHANTNNTPLRVMWWEAADIAQSCVRESLATSWIMLLPIPFLILTTILPLLMLRHNYRTDP